MVEARRTREVLGALGALLALVVLSSCDDTLPRIGGNSYVPQSVGDGGVGCVRPEVGCPCDPGTTATECYLEPELVGGSYVCRVGARYCRDGAYTECEPLRSYPLPTVVTNALITAPSPCNVCDPACQSAIARPDDSDLTTENSSNVAYDPRGGGITIVPEGWPGGDPAADMDGDGIPNVGDACTGPGFRAPCDGTLSDDGLFHVLPYGGAPASDVFTVPARLRSADVYLLLDATGSMEGEFAQLRASLTTGTLEDSCAAGVDGGLLGAIRCAIPDTAFGVGYFREYADDHAGYEFNAVYTHLLDITTSVEDTRLAVSRLYTQGNHDVPESITQALFATVTGRGLGRHLPNRGACTTPGAVGYPCFRPGSVPIVITVTDAMYHAGPNGYDYDDAGYTAWPPAILPETVQSGVSGDVLHAEDSVSAMDLGDATNAYRSLVGSTWGMRDDSSNATPSLDCHGGGAGDAVFRFSLSTRRRLVIDTRGSSFDTTIALRGADFQPIDGACNDDSPYALGYGAVSLLDVTLDAGTYYVVVDGVGGQEGDFRLELRALNATFLPGAPASGERQESAIPLGSLVLGTPLFAYGSLVGHAADYTISCGDEGSPDVVYRFDVATAGPVVVDTRGSSFDTALSIRDASFAQVACNDDSADESDGRTSVASFLAAPGTYYAVVGGRAGRTSVPAIGDYEINVAQVASSTPAPAMRGDVRESAVDLEDVTDRFVVRSGSTAMAIDDYTLDCAPSTDDAPDVVFAFTLSSPRTVRIDTVDAGCDAGSTACLDPVIELRDASFATLDCNDDAMDTGVTPELLAARITRPLAAGTYYVVVDGFPNGRGAGSGSFFLSVDATGTLSTPRTPRTADRVADALPLGDLTDRSAVVEGEVGALGDDVRAKLGIGACGSAGVVCAPEATSDAVYGLTLTTPRTVRIDTHGSTIDTALSVHAADAVVSADGYLPALQLDLDVSRTDPTSEIVTTLPAGRYVVVVEGAGSGRYRLSIDTGAAASDLYVGESGTLTRLGAEPRALGDLGAVGTTVAFDVNGAWDDLESSCGAMGDADQVLSFDLSSRTAIALEALVRDPSDTPVDTALSIRAANGTTELACWNPRVSARARGSVTLEAGRYLLVVESAARAGRATVRVQPALPPSTTPGIFAPHVTHATSVPWSEVRTALVASDVRVIGITSCDSRQSDYVCADVQSAAASVAQASGAVNASGAPFAYTISPDGTGLDTTIATAVREVAQYARMDVRAIAVDSPDTTFDERRLVASLELVAPPARCSGGCSGATCGSCLPGTEVAVHVAFENDVVQPSSMPQTFDFAIDVYAGASLATHMPIRVVVPPVPPPYEPEGAFHVDYDSTLRCVVPPQRPIWGTLAYEIPTPIPEGTSIELVLRTADSAAALASATPAATKWITPSTPLSSGTTGKGEIDVAAALIAAGAGAYHLDLRVEAILHASSDRLSAPTLRGFTIDFECVDLE